MSYSIVEISSFDLYQNSINQSTKSFNNKNEKASSLSSSVPTFKFFSLLPEEPQMRILTFCANDIHNVLRISKKINSYFGENFFAELILNSWLNKINERKRKSLIESFSQFQRPLNSSEKLGYLYEHTAKKIWLISDHLNWMDKNTIPKFLIPPSECYEKIESFIEHEAELNLVHFAQTIKSISVNFQPLLFRPFIDNLTITFQEKINYIRQIFKEKSSMDQVKYHNEINDDLKSCQLTYLSPEIIKILLDPRGNRGWLYSPRLNLSDNRLQYLPNELFDFCRIKALTELNLSHNHFVSLPSYFKNLPSLKKLDLSFNRLKSIPLSFAYLKLETLNLGHNRLKKISPALFKNKTSEKGCMRNLSELYLDDNQLEEIPDTIGDLVSLKKLYLNNNHLLQIPSIIGNLPFLDILDLKNNDLEFLPNTISSQHRLSLLDISNNPLITPIPNNIKRTYKIIMDENVESSSIFC